MASLLSPRLSPRPSPRRVDAAVALRATVAHTERVPDAADEARPPRVSWLLAALGGGAAAALTGWITVCGVAVLGWLAATSGSFPGAMRVGTQLWLLANGAGARLGSTSITLAPWGVTLLGALLVSRFSAFAGRQARLAEALGTGWRAVGAVSGVVMLTYLAPVLATALLLGSPIDARGAVGAFLIAGAALAGGYRGVGCAAGARWPSWLRALPKAVLGAQLVLIATGAAALTVALMLQLDRVVNLTTGLQAGPLGGVALWLAQVAYLPNAVCWAASYTLGAGFSLGQASVVAPAATQVGLLPSIPLLGALPTPGPGSPAAMWWLTAGFAAGGLCAWMALRGRRARWDLSALVGGLSGVLSGLLFGLVAWASGGDLGTVRLAGLGPRLVPLLVLAATTLGLAGLLVGLLLGLLRRPGGWRRAKAGPAGPETAASPAEGSSG